MYLQDLTPHPYEREYMLFKTLSVGWLAKDKSYRICSTCEDFRERLFLYCLYPVLRTRGFHECEFCASPSSETRLVRRDKREIWLGSAEIRVMYEDAVYAAPDLIYHYVTEHMYCPPDEFIEAVLRGPLPDSPAYKPIAEFFSGM